MYAPHALQVRDMGHVGRLGRDAAEVHAVGRGQVFYQVPSADFLALVGGPGHAVADEKEVAHGWLRSSGKNWEE